MYQVNPRREILSAELDVCNASVTCRLSAKLLCLFILHTKIDQIYDPSSLSLLETLSKDELCLLLLFDLTNRDIGQIDRYKDRNCHNTQNQFPSYQPANWIPSAVTYLIQQMVSGCFGVLTQLRVRKQWEEGRGRGKGRMCMRESTFNLKVIYFNYLAASMFSL